MCVSDIHVNYTEQCIIETRLGVVRNEAINDM